ncbi:phosphoglycerate dehydrogenase [Tuwongella immobilis]|uniref:D-isomer specific 2-hydroxyacid dehydrogenase NAD-binding domain-containing protein n=1 Tax=Tuwongella immobilis TaxID=692036 RepID=A0A6C2YPM5_9BACT|nr:phosphoglycerate dehydrogenase [Tuwongella immobilis]VIP03139.1 phosphoglycerate dehydrogenase : Lactate dehydrogenase-like oxidoreductase OS=Singulisphaera acidiphila (strain ATCC BAA-1392 / DSM 18658 / VKM B-2454 / MOB10) GN=Sinac_3563 PE=3 SV=1: 2-Hacid_dh: 2-Hacid_dh_C [Tuwongella immobilis]VTS03505.1 phosphoglycerate dehydrogenase : Lactate dehydrogenase-like oxidoreductase OS=Singulisphaera acidiphila (strain ATCC BAA-1392 / DSM 18658 / VKM B-2454 / MOB10) GN=Sinac_3563 PE=3 SV=1: 2-Haci
MKPKVLVGPSHVAHIQDGFVTTLDDAGLERVYPPRAVQMIEAEVAPALRGVRYSLAGSEPYSRATIESSPDLRVIARAGVGWDAVDVDAATDAGVIVTYAPGTNHEAVGEHTLLLILALAKSFLHQHNRILAGEWPRKAYQPIRGKTLGIIGLGRTGKATATRALAFGMRVIASEIAPDSEFLARYPVELVSQEQVLRQADFLSLHVPLTPLTRHLMNRETLSAMKPTAYLINCSRGTVVHEPELFEALSQKQIAGAGLDVFDEEPLAADHPFRQLTNVLFTAHTAGVDLQSRDEMVQRAADAIVRIHRGEWPEEWIVNPEVRSRRRLDGSNLA